jgi:membrane protease YdiL (CAAX protease family)
VPFNDEVQNAKDEVVTTQSRGRYSPARIAATLLVLVILQLPFGNLVPGNGIASQMGREGLFWLMTLLLVAYILFIEKRPLSSIGLTRPAWKSFVFGLAAAVIMFGGAAAIYLVVFPALGLKPNQAGLGAIQSTPFWFQALVVLRAPIFEEIYYRGFMIERLTEMTGLRWLAALISLTAFTFAHLSYWGWTTLIVVAFQGAILTILYLLRRDLSANMLAHFLVDAAAFLFL